MSTQDHNLADLGRGENGANFLSQEGSSKIEPRIGDVAQLGERYARIVEVVGSSPIVSISFNAGIRDQLVNAL